MASDKLGVVIQDTIPLQLELGFLEHHGGVITSIEPGHSVITHIVATDICDSEPVAEGAMVPVLSVQDGDRIVIKKG